MAIREQDRFVTRAEAGAVDEGLRSYMLRVYNYMMLGLALTGAVAYGVASTPAIQQVVFGSGLMWLFILAPVALVLLLSFRIHKMSFASAQITYWIYAALNGVAFSTIFLAYTGTSIARVFFITAATFGALSLYGYTTKRDLSGFGSFLFMGLIGILIAAVVNMFLASSALQFAISVIGVLVFAGLTAYDTQQIKELYYAVDDSEIVGKKAIMGALRLYLDFINMFVMLLQLFGNRN
ncbi:MAG TPA: Bax inhibitor-1/YccA family protein [Alphaproteobacteria bacterium]|jgi:FtsH-binding integral membrane protein|nr:Bax inhibitor-1/YccA family protein [Alphaproteobacteria bacterium]